MDIRKECKKIKRSNDKSDIDFFVGMGIGAFLGLIAGVSLAINFY